MKFSYLFLANIKIKYNCYIVAVQSVALKYKMLAKGTLGW